MLGWTSSNAGLCGPNAMDTPLVPWLKRHGLGAAGQPLEMPFGSVRAGEAQRCNKTFEGDVGHSTASRPGQSLVLLRRTPKL